VFRDPVVLQTNLFPFFMSFRSPAGSFPFASIIDLSRARPCVPPASELKLLSDLLALFDLTYQEPPPLFLHSLPSARRPYSWSVRSSRIWRRLFLPLPFFPFPSPTACTADKARRHIRSYQSWTASSPAGRHPSDVRSQHQPACDATHSTCGALREPASAPSLDPVSRRTGEHASRKAASPGNVS